MSRAKTVVSANQTRSIASKYSKGTGMVALSTEFGVSIPVIRRTLVDSGAEIRGRGRPAVVA